ncbi:hypothetical protein [Streptomyces sp. 62]|uniref:hypothetical protein n=1 Tax=Streptomyces sp. NPDC013171 TaxID=3364863 RepID=UPI000E258772
MARFAPHQRRRDGGECISEGTAGVARRSVPSPGNTKIADHIIVMERGRITKQGQYDDLAHGGGTFAEFLELSQDR